MERTFEVEEVAMLIPTGHKNAITLDQVVTLFDSRGIIDGSNMDCRRRARKIIERVGYDYVICNLQDGKGYFRPTADDISSYRKWIHQEESRLSKISKRLKIGRKLFEDYLKERLDEQEIENGREKDVHEENNGE